MMRLLDIWCPQTHSWWRFNPELLNMFDDLSDLVFWSSMMACSSSKLSCCSVKSTKAQWYSLNSIRNSSILFNRRWTVKWLLRDSCCFLFSPKSQSSKQVMEARTTPLGFLAVVNSRPLAFDMLANYTETTNCQIKDSINWQKIWPLNVSGCVSDSKDQMLQPRFSVAVGENWNPIMRNWYD